MLKILTYACICGYVYVIVVLQGFSPLLVQLILMSTGHSSLFLRAPRELQEEWLAWIEGPPQKLVWRQPWIPKQFDTYGKNLPKSWIKWDRNKLQELAEKSKKGEKEATGAARNQDDGKWF